MATLNDTPTIETLPPPELDEIVTYGDFLALVIITVDLQVTAPLLSTQEANVELQFRPPFGDWNAAASAFLRSSQTAGLSLLAIQNGGRQTMVAMIPRNWEYRVTQTGGTGSVLLSQRHHVIWNGA